MSKNKQYAGQTSNSLAIFVQDTSSTTGGGLSGVTNASSGLVLEYRRYGQSTWTSVTPVSKTLGTYVSGGIVADGSLAGAYEVDFPDAAFAAGARLVWLRVRGVTNMLPVLIEIELDAVNYQDGAGFGLSRINDTITSRMASYTQPTGFLTATFPSTVASTTNITSASGIVLAAQTHTGAVIPTVTSVTNAVVLPSSATINITGNITGNVSGSVGSVTGNVGGNVVGSVGSISGVTFPTNFGSLSITVGGGVTVATNSDKTGYALTQSFPTNFASLAITSGGAVTAGTVSDKTGYSLSVAPLTSSQTASAVWDALLSSYTVLGSFGARVTRLDSASSGNAVKVTGAGHIASDIHDLQPAVINNTHFAAGAIDASAIASNAITSAKIASGAITSATFAADSITATALATSAGEEIADKVWDEAIAAHLAAGSTGEALNNAGGSGNPWITDLATGYTGTQAGNILNQVKAKTDLITTGTIQSSIPVTAQGQIVGPLYIGDDYLNANGRSFQWTVALPSGFVAGTATCKFGMDHAEGAETGASFLVSGTVVDVGSGNVTLRFDVPRATTGGLVPGYYRWSVEIASAGGNEVTRVASAGNKLVEWREKQT